MNRFASRLLAFAVALGALAGCPLPPPPAPDDIRAQSLPNFKPPENWVSGAADQGEVTHGWLALFHEPALEALVAEAMLYNVDLQAAVARVEAAEASARAAGAVLYPQLNFQGRGGGKMSGDNSGLTGAGLFASWELDLWGRVRSVRSGGAARYEATAFETAYARQSIAALVAKSWFLAREATLQRAIAGDMIESSQSLVTYAQNRLQVGRGDELEVNSAEANVLAYRDLQLQADLARSNAIRAIETLVGRYPAGSIDPGMDLPAPPGTVPVGLPSQLLERRPDVRAAERRVAAAFYGVTEARAARLPRISLTAGVSSVSSELFVIKNRENPAWSVGGTLLIPLFTGGQLEATVDVRSAEQKFAIADYGRIGSRAFSEVEGALSASFNLDTRADILARAVQANERALGFARVRYDVGSGDQRAVQQQQLALHTARTTLVHVQAERLIQRINLHLALGGGFEAAAP